MFILSWVQLDMIYHWSSSIQFIICNLLKIFYDFLSSSFSNQETESPISPDLPQ